MKSSFANISIFVFLSIFTAKYIPDLDLPKNILGFLGHRSIFTHSILFPYLFYYFFKKKGEPTELIKFITYSIYFGLSIHFCADLFVKGWRGTSLIIVFGYRLPDFLSIIWIFGNAVLSMVFANKILFKTKNSKKLNYTYFFLGIPIAFIYFLTDYIGKPAPQFLLFLLIHCLSFYFLIKKSKNILVTKPVTKEAKKEKIQKEKKINYAFVVSIFLVITFITVLIIENLPGNNPYYNSGGNTVEDFRSKNLYEDEVNLCSSNLKKVYPKARFTRIKVSNFYITRDKTPYEKILNMWADHKRFMMIMSWGKIDCKIRVNLDQTIKFLELSNKY